MRSKLLNLCVMSAAAMLASSVALVQPIEAADTNKYMVIDGHNDLPWQYRERFGNRLAPLDVAKRQDDLDPPLHTDLPRLREGGVGAQFWSVYVPIEAYGGAPGDASLVLTQMDVVRRLVEKYPDDLALAMTAADIRSASAEGKIGSLMGIEGGHAIENSLGTLRSLYAAGARYMTLTHSKGLAWADSATDAPRHDGLTSFGETVVREMNRLGMLVDLSHVTEATMHDSLDTVTAPVIFSHSSARAVADHPRNVPDSVLKRLPKNGGVVMVTFVPGYISQDRRDWDLARTGEQAGLKAMYPHDEEKRSQLLTTWESAHPMPEVTLAQVADHIDHIRKVAGLEHIGVGGDFDGISAVVKGLEDVSTYPALFEELKARGYSDADCDAIAGGNVLRALEESEKVAQRLQRKALAQDPPKKMLGAE
ncbi:dipeptidase [Congregibacter variabilis]|uniref:Dipeptidase n=1 Tax=Congregibacter variabilis TaxID=3081200 RepID=A0ABZ0I4K4_9GAMM|nr:dipeptidase [Congregibacter sp. IMCC43200]